MTRTAGILLAAALLAQTSVAFAQTRSVIGYNSVSEALSTLRTKAGVTFSNDDGWTIVKDTDGANWSFTPAIHYAHPSVGRRTIEEYQGRYYVRTELLCQATKVACDKLHEDYKLLDKRMNEAISKGK